MYKASTAFHNAVKTGNRQLPVFVFDDAIITSQDINISGGGIKYSQSVSPKDDLVPGNAVSATMSFDIFNENGLLDDFVYGRFKGFLGVQISNSTYQSDANCYVKYQNTVFTGHDTAPYFRVNGVESTEGTSFPVKCICVYQSLIYAIGEGDNVEVFRYVDGVLISDFTRDGSWDSLRHTTWQEALERYTWRTLADVIFGRSNRFNLYKARSWVLENMGIVWGDSDGTAPLAGNNLKIYKYGVQENYEFVPLGVFSAERPVYSTKKSLSVDAYDIMTDFDRDYTGSGIVFPITLGNLFQKVCDICNVECAGTTFTNSTLVVEKAPDEFKSSTYRDILGWIAEIACCFCRITRDGKAEMKWFSNVNASFSETDYTEANVAYYKAAGVSQIEIRDSQNDAVTYRSGSNVFYIENNPIIRVLRG